MKYLIIFLRNIKLVFTKDMTFLFESLIKEHKEKNEWIEERLKLQEEWRKAEFQRNEEEKRIREIKKITKL